jgi:hypothetical protein
MGWLVAEVSHEGTASQVTTRQAATEVVTLGDGPVNDTVMPGVGGSHQGARLASLAVLGLVTLALFYAGRGAYYLATDGQIAPFMLTPDSDVVTGSRLSLASLSTERDNASAQREGLEQELVVTRESLERLAHLYTKFQKSLGIVHEASLLNERSSLVELQKLRDQKLVIDVALADQQSHVLDTQQRVESGLAHATELVREQAEVRRLTLLQLQRERDEVGAESRIRELHLQTLSETAASGRSTPEVLRLEDQRVRLELELHRLQAEEHGKLAQLRAINAQAQRLDELIGHLKDRPLFRAIAKKQTLAFIPYTQLRGIDTSSSIYECKLWSMFFCQYVGHISEVLPGEIAATDPWGAPARGEYAVMELTEPRAVMAKTLRVRHEQDLAKLWTRATARTE